MNRFERKDLTMISSTPSGSTKNPGSRTQTVSCSVDGCSSDLSKCKLYHRRHRVCEGHSKAPVVTVRGQKKRFCQQCSRFHPLEEFDEVKRSCRKRLAGHNRRRRKPKLGSFGGIQFLQFGTPQIPATTTAISYQNQQLRGDTNSFTWTYNEKYERFPFVEPKHHQRSSQVAAASGDSFWMPHLQSILSSESGRGGHESDENIQSIHSNCALCLLSMNSLPTPGISLNHFVQSDLINPILPQGSEMHASTVAVLSPIVFPGVRETFTGCNGMFDARSDSLLEHGMCSTLPGL